MSRAASHIHTLQNAQLHLQVNDELMRLKAMRYELIPTGVHTKSGLVEAKMKSLGLLMGPLNLQKGEEMSIINLQTMILQIEELCNNTPLGLTMNQKDPLLQLLTPTKLAGGFPKRAVLSPPAIPMDVSGILAANERKWSQIVKIYEKTVIPELLRVKKWFNNKLLR